MKIIFSPSKSQNEQYDNLDQDTLTPLFMGDAHFLKQVILEHPLEDLSVLYKISHEKIANIVAKYCNNSQNLNIPSIRLFSGTSFKQLELNTYNQAQKKYLQNNMIIFSALYGILHPYDGISPYRLDMNNNILKKTNYKNLYNFWQSKISDYFKDTAIVLNLASSEYSKLLNNFSGKIVNVDFKVEKNNRVKSVAVYSKQQRGKLLHHMIKNNITDLSFLENYSSDGFVFHKQLSSENTFVFLLQV